LDCIVLTSIISFSHTHFLSLTLFKIISSLTRYSSISSSFFIFYYQKFEYFPFLLQRTINTHKYSLSYILSQTLKRTRFQNVKNMFLCLFIINRRSEPYVWTRWYPRASSERISPRRRCSEATVRTARTDADSLERTQLMRSQSETVRSGLTPCPSRYRFWVTSSCLALRGIPRSHCAFVRQLVRSSPDRETYTTANPPSSATSRRENRAAPTEMTLEKKGTTSHHGPTRMLAPGTLRERAMRESSESEVRW